MENQEEWLELRRLFARSFASSLHFAVASVDGSGAPMVTPVGTVFLGEPGHAYYFELYAKGLGARLAANPRVAILAVDSDRRLWLRSLLRGRFVRSPSVRLIGTAEPRSRRSTDAERARAARRLGLVRHLRGGRILWPDFASAAGRNVHVRDVAIERVEAIRFGAMAVDGGERWAAR